MDQELNNSELTFTYSGITKKSDEKIVYVSFERVCDGIKHFAEGILPQCCIEKQEGFSEEEIKFLEIYLKENMDFIFEKAKDISLLKNWIHS